MKVFALTLVLFLLMLCVIVCNALYINRMAFSLRDQLDALPAFDDPACADAAHTFLDAWKEQVTLVGLSVEFPIVDRITEHASLLAACADCGDRFGYVSALTLLYDAIDDMRRLETLHR